MKRSLLFLLATVMCSAEPIRIEGSDALGAKLVPMLSRLYEEINPGVTFSIAANGSTAAFTALSDKVAEIGMSNREPRPAELEKARERGITLLGHIAAYDAFALIVNAENSTEDLTLKQVEAVFTGDIISWDAAGGATGPIVVYTRNTASGSYTDFRELAMSGREYAKAAVKIVGSDSPALAVANDRRAVTYVGLLLASEPNVRALRIEGLGPSHRSYPLRRRYFYFIRDDAGPRIKDFVSWATHSEEARALVREVGFLEPENEK
jgi:phosphate transport system substrate-binding protein